MNKISISNKITLLFVGLLTISVIIIGLYSYYNVWSLLYIKTAQHLRAQAKPIINKQLLNTNENLKKIAPMLAKNLTSKITSAIIFDEKGHVIAKGKILPEEPEAPSPNLNLVKKALKGEKEISYLTKLKNTPILVILVPLKKSLFEKNIIGVAQISTSLLPVYKILFRHGIMLLVVSIIVLAIGAFTGYFLIAKSLANLKNMAAVCEKVSEGDFSHHLNYGSEDEIGKVAKSFDNMVDKVKNMIESQERFVANAAHELRTPLSTLKGSCEVLLRGAQDDPATLSKILKVMYGEINRLINICEKLLGLTKLHTSIKVNMKKIDIEKFLSNFYSKIKLTTHNRKIFLKKDKPITIEADEDILNQILYDLFSNSVNFTKDDGKITIGWKVQNSIVEIFVEDNGCGIAKHDIEKIFEPFYQVSGKKRTGAGLGLAIVKSMSEAINPKINIYSKFNKGTKISILLKI
jgi:signal transduction histidine kinase